jgi:hypothetical protein
MDILVIATYWYGVNAIKPHFSNWWKRNIAREIGPGIEL